jgi:transcriptional regulator with XRE-family HTH domain
MTSEQLKKLRNKHGLTQKEFADCIGMPIDTYRPKEQGRIKIIEKDVKKIKECFKS